jgi:hypothetical protein
MVEKSGAGKPHYEEVADIGRVTFDPKTAFEAIYAAATHLFDEFYDRRPTQVLIGSGDMAELMNSEQIREAGMRGFGLDFKAPAGFNGQIFGLNIKVVPHMKGILVL